MIIEYFGINRIQVAYRGLSNHCYNPLPGGMGMSNLVRDVGTQMLNAVGGAARNLTLLSTQVDKCSLLGPLINYTH